MKLIIMILTAVVFATAGTSFLLPGVLKTPVVIVECNQTIPKEKFSLCYNYDLLIPTVAFYKITSDDVLTPPMAREYLRTDKDIPKQFRPSMAKYKHTGYDAGHLPAAASIDVDKISADEVFIVNACAPQNPKLNRLLWKYIETEERKLALLNGLVYVITGIIPSPENLPSGLNIPSYYYKIVWIPSLNKWISWKAPNLTWNSTNSLQPKDYLIDTKKLLESLPLKLKNFNLPK